MMFKENMRIFKENIIAFKENLKYLIMSTL